MLKAPGGAFVRERPSDDPELLNARIDARGRSPTKIIVVTAQSAATARPAATHLFN
jgi:hypothetical protein